MGVNAPILSTLSLKLLLFTAPFFYVRYQQHQSGLSLLCVSMQVCVCVFVSLPSGIGS